MAIYHLSAQIIKRADGRSSVAAAAYRCGARMENPRTGETHDFSRKAGVFGVRQLLPEGAPDWMADPAACWASVEQAEKRKDAQLAREINFALPVELDNRQREALAVEFARAEFVGHGMVGTLALHDFDGGNPHAHLMLSMRSVSPEGWGKKNRDWNNKDLLKAWREAWQEHANRALAQAGHKARIDHRTLLEQSEAAQARGDLAEARRLARRPEIHLGPKPGPRKQSEQAGIEREKQQAAAEAAKWERWHRAEVEAQHRQAVADRQREHPRRREPRGREARTSAPRAPIDPTPTRLEVQNLEAEALLRGLNASEAAAMVAKVRRRRDKVAASKKGWKQHHPFLYWLDRRGWFHPDELTRLRRELVAATEQVRKMKVEEKRCREQAAEAREKARVAKEKREQMGERKHTPRAPKQGLKIDPAELRRQTRKSRENRPSRGRGRPGL